ncbi:hypothetical protein QM646_50865, partial [Rhodococcus erythropolis]|nr:hypothetical protein [Rhodococcus erythropolis]
SDAILAAKSHKELLEELASAIAARQVRTFKLAVRDGRPALNGAVPAYGETDTATMYALLSAYTVLHFAQQLAAART